ncbi:PQQ-dependent sugar dehydrogenase [Hydrocarboniphaga effusa]|uniref:PQQ-dependent sugar dehydrogenase n=1 Tax=Hydrocarboniphaga effusa TaxID=243629 RepID=UPI003137B73B
MHRSLKMAGLALLAGLAACSGGGSDDGVDDGPGIPTGLDKTSVARFNQPWAMSFLLDGRMLVTERRGTLRLVTQDGTSSRTVSGVPAVSYGGQGGLGDVVLHPRFSENGWVYLSYAEAGERGTRGAALARARLELASDGGAALRDLQVIWRQTPKVGGTGHYSHRLAFAPNGDLFLTSGERQLGSPAQDLAQNLGKVLRLKDDGTPADGNPFADQGAVAAQVWSYGHRNLLGIAFDADGRLWTHEMGPQGGDELNRIERGSNYGWPIVSNGNNYDGSDIPDHDTRPEFDAPEVSWNPVIAAAGFIIYSGSMFPSWRGDGFIGGLVSHGLVRIDFDGDSAREAERLDFGERIREVEQGPDGAIWVLEDGDSAQLFKLTPSV